MHWTGAKGSSLNIAAVKAKATKLNTAVIWNCSVFLVTSMKFLPHFRKETIDLKLLSSMTTPDAYFAVSAPFNPIEKPTRAFLRAGASKGPPPVMAATFYCSFKPIAKRFLSSGDAFARTLSLELTF